MKEHTVATLLASVMLGGLMSLLFYLIHDYKESKRKHND
jgi:hypothetical protein